MVLRASRYKDKEKLRKTRNAQNKRYFSKTAIYKPRRWTDIEDVIILEHKNTDMQISKQIERSVKAIQVRRVKLKKMEQNTELAKVRKQLAIAVDDLYVIASNANPDFNRMEYAEKSLQKIKELKQDD